MEKGRNGSEFGRGGAGWARTQWPQGLWPEKRNELKVVVSDNQLHHLKASDVINKSSLHHSPRDFRDLRTMFAR